MAKSESNTNLSAIVGAKLRPTKIRDMSMHAFYAAADGLENVSTKLHQKYVKFGFRDPEMHLAVQRGDKRAVVELLVDGVNPSAPAAGKGVTPLSRAIEYHYDELTTILLNATRRRSPGELFNASPTTGESLLHVSAKHLNWKAFETLSKIGLDQNQIDHNGLATISIVAQNADSKVLSDSIKNGGDPQTLDENEMPVAFHVLTGNATDKIEMLEVLRESGANLTGKFGAEKTSLLSIAAQFCNREVVEYLLLQPNMDPNSLTEQGLSPLHFSTLNDQPGVTRALLAHGAQPNALSKAQEAHGIVSATPLMLAAGKNNLEACDALLDDPRTNIMINVPGTKQNALSIANDRGNEDISRLIQIKIREKVNAATNDSAWNRLSASKRLLFKSHP